VLTLYLAALIFGLGTFITQLLFSSEGSHGPSESPQLDAGGAPHDAGAELQPGPSLHSATEWASVFLSLRFYMFAAIGVGVVGAPVTWLGLSTPTLTLAVSLATGLLLGLSAAMGFRLLGRQTLTSGAGPAELVGQVGRVLVACEKGRRGKVRLKVRGQLIDYLASTDEARLAPGSAVLVQEVQAEGLWVCAAPIELLQDDGDEAKLPEWRS
jgi:membrane protein implicated in regulation of membrane protease activity